MKANELRIGNFVFTDNIELLEVSAGDLVVMDNFPDDYKPIPITEEWLVKFGFIESEPTECGIRYFSMEVNFAKIFHILIYKNLKIDFTIDCEEFYKVLTEIKYVHQLQNLYFALTREELQLKQ